MIRYMSAEALIGLIGFVWLGASIAGTMLYRRARRRAEGHQPIG